MMSKKRWCRFLICSMLSLYPVMAAGSTYNLNCWNAIVHETDLSKQTEQLRNFGRIFGSMIACFKYPYSPTVSSNGLSTSSNKSRSTTNTQNLLVFYPTQDVFTGILNSFHFDISNNICIPFNENEIILTYNDICAGIKTNDINLLFNQERRIDLGDIDVAFTEIANGLWDDILNIRIAKLYKLEAKLKELEAELNKLEPSNKGADDPSNRVALDQGWQWLSQERWLLQKAWSSVKEALYEGFKDYLLEQQNRGRIIPQWVFEFLSENIRFFGN